MAPVLIGLAGPLEGQSFSLLEGDVSIGRGPSNRLSIADALLSRQHCRIQAEAGRLKIRDLDSLNGTFVNDVPVKERTLDHGDRIRIGNSVFLFLEREGEPPPAGRSVDFEESPAVPQTTLMLRSEEALYLQPEKVGAVLPPSARLARDLNALLKISQTIHSLGNSDELQRQLLELIFDVIPAERGAILLAGTPSEEFASVVAAHRAAPSTKPIPVSRTIVRQVLRERVAILSQDAREDQALAVAQSLLTARTRSLLCVPLEVFQTVLGVIYLDTTDPAVRFDEGHMQLLLAIAGVAALALRNIQSVEWLQGENRRLQADARRERPLIGESPRLREVHQFIAKVAPTHATVLIRGESGTGKELTARAIHLNSPRAQKPFVAINCAVLTETLLESELFGYEKGAFTGATAQKKGKLEAADGGTLFLDEVAELAPNLQAKLLRVLQEREFERVGGTRPIRVDIRLIAATNRDLEAAIRRGTFRADLYYRLNVVALTMPPLRERREDIPLLASYFADKYGRQCRRRVLGLSTAARTSLIQYDWPGNVRELENALERAVVLGSTEYIQPEDLPEAVLESEPSASAEAPEGRLSETVSETRPEPETAAGISQLYEGIKAAKKQLILKAVQQARGNYVEAAKLLGVHPNNLHRLVRNLNLKSALKP